MNRKGFAHCLVVPRWQQPLRQPPHPPDGDGGEELPCVYVRIEGKPCLPDTYQQRQCCGGVEEELSIFEQIITITLSGVHWMHYLPTTTVLW